MLRLSRGNVYFWYPFAHQFDCEKLGTFWWVTNEMDSNSCCNSPEGSVSLVRCYPSTKMKGHSAFPLSAPVHCDRWYWVRSVIGQNDLARSAFIDAMAMFFWWGLVHYLCSWQDELPQNFFLLHCNTLRIQLHNIHLHLPYQLHGSFPDHISRLISVVFQALYNQYNLISGHSFCFACNT